MTTNANFWRTHLREIPPPDFAFASDAPTPAALQHISVRLPTELRLLSSNSYSAATWHSFALAAFAIYLARITSQAQLTLGVMPTILTTALQQPDQSGTLAPCLPLQIELDFTCTFSDMHPRVQQALNQIHAHAFCGPELFAHLDLPFGAILSDTPLNPLPASTHALTLILAPDQMDLLFDTGRISTALASRMGLQFENLLTSLVLGPQRALYELALVPPAERTVILEMWNATDTAYPLTQTLPHLLAEAAAHTPDAVAIQFGTAQLTYAELHTRANQLAHHLRQLGAAPDLLIGICIERSFELMIGLLAILKAGAAYVPLDPDYPQDRLAFMLLDARCAVLLTLERHLPNLPTARPPTLCLDAASTHTTLAQYPPSAPALNLTARHLAYTIYTSGSTGQPRGAMNEHAAVVNRLLWMRDYLDLQPHDRILQKTPISFDVSVWELFLPLLVGARLVLAQPSGHRDPAYLARLITQAQISVAHFVPSMLRVFLATPTASACRSLRHIICSGEELPTDLYQHCIETLPATLHNLYGPTEAAVDVTAWRGTLPADALRVPIGRPIANTRIYILDVFRQLVPIGMVGELYIGGVAVGRGYLHQPALTAERFVPDPFTPEAGARLYRTGDLARYGEDGQIEFLGRVDQQIKLRGFRIEPGEIEARLREHAAVRDATVIARRNPNTSDTQLLAYIVPNAAASPPIQQWGTIYDEFYRQQNPAADPTFNTAGWISSYTGTQMPDVEVQAWLTDTLAPLHALHPQHIFEIGCGTGMLLFRLAPHCTSFWASDPSEQALVYIQQHLASTGIPAERVRLLHRPADDFSTIPTAHFDVIIINSVVHYFPSVAYLTHVLEGALHALKPGGTLLIGDVRNYRLLRAFHTSVQLAQAAPETPIAQLAQHVATALLNEEQLTLDPALFTHFAAQHPDIATLTFQLKRSPYPTEHTRFRYNVLLTKTTATTKLPVQPVIWHTWQSDQPLETQLQHCFATLPPAVGLRQIPNARIHADVLASRLLENPPPILYTAAELRDLIASQRDPQSVDPDTIRAYAEPLGYHTDISWSADDPAAFDMLCWQPVAGYARPLQPLSRPAPHTPPPALEQFASNPQLAALTHTLPAELRAFLQSRLPDYMVPLAFMLLNELPLTPSGKLNRRALPDVPALPLAYAGVAPRTALEQQLAQIWSDVLAAPKIGVTDEFLALGGHSLRAAQIIARMRSDLGVDLPLRVMFEATTIERLAQAIEALRWMQHQPHPRPDDIPATDLEEGEL
ncbi:MAG: amino acid adenylation domain-containing protein [Chloroflexaceae bacterium]|nr:amino acid adenylation domain-containing protein [Chloroflexaceae bacterium]